MNRITINKHGVSIAGSAKFCKEQTAKLARIHRGLTLKKVIDINLKEAQRCSN